MYQPTTALQRTQQEETDTMNTYTLTNGATLTLELFEGAFITAHVTTLEGRKCSVYVEDCTPEAWEQALSDAEELAGAKCPQARAEVFGAPNVSAVIRALISELEFTGYQARRYPHMIPHLTEETRRLTQALESFTALI